MRLSALYLFIIPGAIILTSCKKENTDKNFTKMKGPKVEVGEGYAQTFITLNQAGVPLEIGVILTDDALVGLPDVNTLYPLQFSQKAIEAALFDHVVLGLSAAGHGLPPSGHIGAHFDFRFFMMSTAERLAIPAPATAGFPAGGGFDVSPPAGYLPANYAMNAAVAQIGRHWGEDIFQANDHVDHTMIWGTWNGKLTFINPIVTLPTLASGQRYSVAYRQPQYFEKHGYYPTRYNIYKDDEGSHFVTLSDFVWR